ncbi:MAG: inositol-3-phosphate synthase [Syntrophales bacterium]|nr:inositol-3-phosphate synthase [Syntrophales bacterium]
MTRLQTPKNPEILLLVAGAKGAVASTVAAAVIAMRHDPKLILTSMTTADKFPYLGDARAMRIAGWDPSPRSLTESINIHGVLPDTLWRPYERELTDIAIVEPPGKESDLKIQIKNIVEAINLFKKYNTDCLPVLINLLPAADCPDLSRCRSLSELSAMPISELIPDIAYVIAAIYCGIPIINFSPNEVEIPTIIEEAASKRVPMCGRDGKTGQTYLKVVLASALKARSLYIDGWYSVNILGNADGANLNNPEKAKGKLQNKTQLLDNILGYHVGERYNDVSHKVHIDYYPPRGDAKEAWDVIDFLGLFGLPMSLRLNLQGRDSILAAPMVLDLTRWMIALQKAGISGPVPELGFFFKRPVGDSAPVTFNEQMDSLLKLEHVCNEANRSEP